MSIGSQKRSADPFREWVEKGYAGVVFENSERSEPHSWRFWTRGLKKNGILCGLVKDSNDSFGRPYPLLMMGCGHLEEWIERWDLVPFACEETWTSMEVLSVRAFESLADLKENMRLMKAPPSDWAAFRAQRERALESDVSCSEERLLGRDPNGKLNDLCKGGEFLMPLDEDGPYNDPRLLASLWLYLLRKYLPSPPNAVFMGGTPKKAYLAVFYRPLSPADFVGLWSMQ